jgi:probable HAF family extracellular repeat protein
MNSPLVPLASVILGFGLLAPTLSAQQHYTVQDLGTLGGSFSIAFGTNQLGHVAGGANVPDETQHFFFWKNNYMYDAGSLGGNGNAAIASNRDILGGLSETLQFDPNGEDFCGFGTHRICRAAIWRPGYVSPLALPTLGGKNSEGFTVNNNGEIAGVAETDFADPTCSQSMPFQRFRFKPAIFGPALNAIHALPLPQGDTAGVALNINDFGQAVGSTGLCSNSTANGLVGSTHAILWNHGTPVRLDPPGSNYSLSVAAWINNHGEVTGGSRESAIHSFLWTPSGRQNLGTIPGDPANYATVINNLRQIVGVSCSTPFCDLRDPNTQTRAYLWQSGVMYDLNTLVDGNPGLYLLGAYGINDAGQIAGLALDLATFQPHAFLATPNHTNHEPGNPATPATTPQATRLIR